MPWGDNGTLCLLGQYTCGIMEWPLHSHCPVLCLSPPWKNHHCLPQEVQHGPPLYGHHHGPPLSGSHHSSSLGAIPFNIWDVRLCPPQVYCLVALATLSTRKPPWFSLWLEGCHRNLLFAFTMPPWPLPWRDRTLRPSACPWKATMSLEKPHDSWNLLLIRRTCSSPLVFEASAIWENPTWGPPVGVLRKFLCEGSCFASSCRAY